MLPTVIRHPKTAQDNTTINLALASEMAELVYAGGGQCMRKLIEDVRAGRRIEF